MFKIGTKVMVVGPRDASNRVVRDIWWVGEMEEFVGKELFIDGILEPYDEEELYYGNIIYILRDASDRRFSWWFVEEWINPVCYDDTDEENINECMSVAELLGF